MSNSRVGHRRRLAIVLAITGVVLAVEVVGAFVSGSLVLLADAGHMATDAGGITLSLLAMWFAARPASPRRTFGFDRLEILAGVANALLLCGVGVYVVVGGGQRLLAVAAPPRAGPAPEHERRLPRGPPRSVRRRRGAARRRGHRADRLP